MRRFFLFVALLGSLFANAQNFEGTITYKLSYTIQDKAFLKNFPTEMVLFIKGNKLRSDITYQLWETDAKIKATPVSQSKIVDLGTLSYFELLSVGENKFFIETTTKQIEENLAKKSTTPKFAIQDSTKMIKGYLCKIAVLTINYQEATTGTYVDVPLTIYYTEALGNKNIYIDQDFRVINGLMLEYTIFARGIPIKFTATKIKKKKIKDTEFEKPTAGYQKDIEDKETRIKYLLNTGK